MPWKLKNTKGHTGLKRLSSKVAKSFLGGEKGFTLLELLIIVAILGILAGTIIPNVTSFISKGQIAAANAELAEIGTAGQAAASAAGGTLTAGWTSTAAVAPYDMAATNGVALAPFVQGTVKGDYYINTDGSVDIVTNVPKYPSVAFGGTTPGQFH